MTEQTVSVELGERRYTIRIAANVLGEPRALADFVNGPDALIVSNEVVAPLYADRLRESLPGVRHELVILPDGEQTKSLTTIATVLDHLVAMNANRDTTVIALGGGVVGDISGFAASVYQRGVSFIQVPTTLLAQVDSSVGGKTGVNHPAGKNLIGAFHQPAHVLIDTGTLTTLPAREYSAGIAEIIKYAVLGDRRFLAWLENNITALREQDPTVVAEAIRHCCTMKAEIVAGDERERGRRALLNLGHTFGHAIETVAGYGEWLHGEAVAAGMVMAAIASDLPDRDIERLRSLLASAGLPVAPPPLGGDVLWRAMQLDKKVKDGKLRLILLRELGDAYVTADCNNAALQAALALADG
ncbi:MAG: 3-dehydroquinate synthase [Pseudomonadota bacterium]